MLLYNKLIENQPHLNDIKKRHISTCITIREKLKEKYNLKKIATL